MKPQHRQGLQGAMSSLSSSIPPLFPASGSAKTTASLALAWCISSHRGYGYFLLCCNTRSDVPIEKRPRRELTLRQLACPGIPSLHGLPLHDSPERSQLSTPAASPKAKGAESPWDLPLSRSSFAGAG